MRRTSSIDMWWPDGFGTSMHMRGRARDLLTDDLGSAVVLATDEMFVVVDPERRLELVETHPPRPAVDRLVGAQGGSGFRRMLAEAVPDERERRTPLALLLDDVAGASLIGGFAWLRNTKDWTLPPLGMSIPVAPPETRHMEGICSGFRTGASTLRPNGHFIGGGHNVTPVPPLTDPADPIGWHELVPLPPVATRRARRMDVRREDGQLIIDAMFRDSTRERDGVEVAVHEYRIDITADASTGVLTSVRAEPRVLPYGECPAAAANAAWLVGESLWDLRERVLKVISGEHCCTHLNDALRALADVPALVEAIA